MKLFRPGDPGVDRTPGARLDAVSGEEPDYIARNRAAWNLWAPGHVAAGKKAWRDPELRWGVWGTPESKLQLMAGVQPGSDVIELGCGTAEISAWLARRGIRPVAIDLAPKQILTVDTLQREFQVSFPALTGNAEDVLYEDASFDVAISEYGASLWCDPMRWLPEANRLLRPGGTLVFFANSNLLMVCTPEGGGPADTRLQRDFFSQTRLEFDADGAVEFHTTHGNWIRLLRRFGFVSEDLIEVRPSPKAKARYGFVGLEWARRWPSEEIWIARKSA